MNDASTTTFDADAALAALTAQLAPIVADNPDAVIVGVETGGAWIAERLHAHFGLDSPLCTINISFYRDDFSMVGLHPSVGLLLLIVHFFCDTLCILFAFVH